MRISNAQNKCVVGYKFININKNVYWYFDFCNMDSLWLTELSQLRIILSIALVLGYWKETYCIFVTVGMGLMSSVSSQHYQYSEKLWRHPHNHFISNVFVCFLWWLAARGCVCLFVLRIGSHATLPRTTHTLQVCQKYNAVMCNVVMCNIVMCNVVMCNVVMCNVVMCITMSHNPSKQRPVSAMLAVTTDQR